MVLADSHKIPPISWYSGTYSRESYHFRLRDYHPLWSNFPDCSANDMIFYSPTYLDFGPNKPHYPAHTTGLSLHVRRFRHVPRSLATTWGITIVFFSSGYLDVSVPRVSLHTLCIHVRILRHYSEWVVPFGNPRILGYFHLPVAYRR